MKGYKLQDLVLRKKMHSRDVIFREFKTTSKFEEVQKDKEPDKLVFELRNEEHDSDESTKSNEEVEQLTPIVRRSEQVRKTNKRYNPPDFHFVFVLSSTNKEPKLVREAVDSTDVKI
jgi:hypothetical protein